MQELKGLGAIASRYDTVLSDIWGVVHNGVRAHPLAVEALVAFRRQGGRVVLISNAPRPKGPIIAIKPGSSSRIIQPSRAGSKTLGGSIPENVEGIPFIHLSQRGISDLCQMGYFFRKPY